MEIEIINSYLSDNINFNFIIVNEYFEPDDAELFIGNDEEIILIKESDRRITIFDLLVFANIFQSKGIARKNWRCGNLPTGFSEFKNIGKLKKSFTILNPTKT